MQRPSQLFSISDRQQIEQAVAEAESHTSAEIVAAVAGASGRYDRPEDIIGLWTGLVAMGVTWFLWKVEMPCAGKLGRKGTRPAVDCACAGRHFGIHRRCGRRQSHRMAPAPVHACPRNARGGLGSCPAGFLRPPRQPHRRPKWSLDLYFALRATWQPSSLTKWLLKG